MATGTAGRPPGCGFWATWPQTTQSRKQSQLYNLPLSVCGSVRLWWIPPAAIACRSDEVPEGFSKPFNKALHFRIKRRLTPYNQSINQQIDCVIISNSNPLKTSNPVGHKIIIIINYCIPMLSLSHQDSRHKIIIIINYCIPMLSLSHQDSQHNIIPWLRSLLHMWTRCYNIILTLSLPRVINFKFPLQPHQKYYTRQYEELGFS